MPIQVIVPEALENTSMRRKVCASLAHIHREGSPDDLLSQLGVDFLGELFYPAVAASPASVVVTLEEKEKIVGFAAATTDTKGFLEIVVGSRPLESIYYGISRLLLKPWNATGVLAALRLRTPVVSTPTAEILMISILPLFRGKKVGRDLLGALHRELTHRRIRTCLARVREENGAAVALYESSGYVEIGEVRFRGSVWKWMGRSLCEIRSS